LPDRRGLWAASRVDRLRRSADKSLLLSNNGFDEPIRLPLHPVRRPLLAAVPYAIDVYFDNSARDSQLAIHAPEPARPDRSVGMNSPVQQHRVEAAPRNLIACRINTLLSWKGFSPSPCRPVSAEFVAQAFESVHRQLRIARPSPTASPATADALPHCWSAQPAIWSSASTTEVLLRINSYRIRRGLVHLTWRVRAYQPVNSSEPARCRLYSNQRVTLNAVIIRQAVGKFRLC